VTQSTKMGYKSTEVGAIPEDWDLLPFKQISSMHGRIGWQGLKQSEFTMNNDDPYLITGMNFKDGEIRWNEVYHIPKKRFDMAKEIQLKPNDVLMTKDGTIGKVLIIKEIPYPHKACLNSHLLVFRPIGNRYVPIFLYYQLNSSLFKNQIELSKSGTTFFGISQESVGKFKIVLPKRQEQESIGLILHDTDRLINKLDMLIVKKKNVMQGAMQELLTGRKRLHGDWSKNENYKLTEIGKIPVDWEEFTLNSLCKSFTKQTGFDYSAHIKPALVNNFNEDVLSFIQNKDFDGKKINFNTDYFIPESVADRFPAILLDEICLLISISGSIGKIGIFSNTQKAFVGGAIAVAKLRNKTQVDWIMYYLQSPVGQSILFKQVKAGAQHNLILDDLRKILIPMPSDNEQKAIIQILSDMASEIEALERERDKYKLLKVGLLQQLLTGRIRLKCLN
jgi:type I restriction enzyme, S subunit